MGACHFMKERALICTQSLPHQHLALLASVKGTTRVLQL